MNIEATAVEIPKDTWQTYFEDLSDQYWGWRVTVDRLMGEMGDQTVAENAFLQGLSYDPKGSEAGDILVEMGDTTDEYMVHHVDKARSVRAVISEPGGEADLYLEAADGQVSIVRVRRGPELPKGSGEPARRPRRIPRGPRRT